MPTRQVIPVSPSEFQPQLSGQVLQRPAVAAIGVRGPVPGTVPVLGQAADGAGAAMGLTVTAVVSHAELVVPLKFIVPGGVAQGVLQVRIGQGFPILL